MGEQFNNAVSLKELYKAGKQCRKGVGHKDGPVEWCYTGLGSAARLRRNILKGRYHMRPGMKVKIYRPKPREADAPFFVDRVWQRSMCNNGVYDNLTGGFIRENVACQKGKGTDMAIRCIVGMLQRLHREAPGATVWGCHKDIRKYFPNTPQEEIMKLDRERIAEPLFIPYLDEIIDSKKDPRPEEVIAADPHGKRGTGLGSQINQLNQIALLDKLDHRLKEFCRYYIRYNDDFLILDHDREIIRRAEDLINRCLSDLGLESQDKFGTFKAENGFYFLRKRFILTKTGKIIIRLHQDAMREERDTLRKLKRLKDEGRRDMAAIERHYQSWVANAEYASDAPIMEMDKFYTKLLRRKPVYKRKKRYLYGNRTDRQRKDPPVGGGERSSQRREQQTEGTAGVCGGMRLPGTAGRRGGSDQ